MTQSLCPAPERLATLLPDLEPQRPGYRTPWFIPSNDIKHYARAAGQFRPNTPRAAHVPRLLLFANSGCVSI